MPTENISIRLSRETEGSLKGKLGTFEENRPRFVSVEADFELLDKVPSLLASLRASSIPALVTTAGVPKLTLEEAAKGISELYDLNQLTLFNVLSLCTQWIPKEAIEYLELEARTELKWMEEWLSASDDPRIHKVPGLPWRSFVRKIVNENYKFAEELLTLANEAPDGLVEKRIVLIRNFLKEKKKVVCVYPKKWGRT